MCSIAEDQSLPVDFNGTSLQLSSPMDSTVHDPASLSTSDVETPGMFPTLNSVGGISPHRVRTMKDQEQQLAELRKNNFGLKLRIYHLEEAMTKKWGDRSEGWQLNIDLQVQMDNLRKELEEKDQLILQAKEGLNAMAAKHAQELNELRQSPANTDDVRALEQRLEDKDTELEDAQQQTEEAEARANEMQQVNEQLEEEARQKDREMEGLQRELDAARQAVAEQRAAVKTPVPTHNAKVQTTEPVVGRDEVDGVSAELADVNARLQESERAVLELLGEMSQRDGRVKELEVELLTASQKLAAGAGVHAHQMAEQATQLDQCKANLRDAEAKLRRQGAELGERERECREREREVADARQRAREAEDMVGDLESRVRAAEREAKELQRQLREAQIGAEEDAANRARDLRDMEERARQAEERLGRNRPEMAAQQRELEDMGRTLREKEEEVAQLKSRLGDSQADVSRARRATHAANLERQEHARALGELRGEVAALRDQLQQKQASVQKSADAALAAKDGIIGQLQRELHDLRAKLADADERLLHLTTSKAAELGVLQGTVDDLAQQLEQLEGQLRAAREELGTLTGEKAALERKLDKLRAQSEGTGEQVAEMEGELAAKNDQLQAAHRANADLQRLVGELQRAQPSREQLEREAAEKAQLKSQLASLRAALANKEAECQRLGEMLGGKDGTIRDLQEQLRRAAEERARDEERIAGLQREKSALQSEVAGLQSQGRVAQLSSDDLQTRLTDAYREREQLARKLRQAEEALRNKDSAYERARKACEALKRQVEQLQEQVQRLSQRPDTTSVGVATSSPGQQDSGMMAGGVDESVGTSAPQPAQGAGPSSTTMIFGSLSEDILRTILQRLQEVYAEVLTNRTSGTQASSELAAKMEHLTDLQRHLETCFHDSQHSNAQDSKPASGNTSYTSYYFMRGEDGEPLVVGDDNEGGGRQTPPRKSSTPKKSTSGNLSREETCGSVPSREIQAQIGALQSELEEVKRWNEALQTRLKESGGTRDVGVGMEKGATAVPQPSRASFAREKYLELEAEVDRLLGELETERERSQEEREQQETECAALSGELSATQERVGELEQQLREAVMRDAGTSTGEAQALGALGEEVEELKQELEQAETVIAQLKGQLQAEKDDNHRLRGEMAELRHQPAITGGTSSMPNLLLTPDRTPRKATSESWTSPGVTVGGPHSGLDMRELKQRHEEVTRLNRELQRKCREQLHKSPPSATTSAASLQERSQAEEQSVERECSLLTQLRQSESHAAEKEAQWRARERGLQRQLADLEGRLGRCNHDCEIIRGKLTASLAACREKDEQRANLTRRLSQSAERVRQLEHQLEQLLASKTAAIRQLEERQVAREVELQSTRERAEELAQRLEMRQREEEEGEDEGREEVATLRDSVDSLTRQLTSALKDLEGLQRQNSGLEEHRNLLQSQLSSCQEQVATLQAELRMYQTLVQDRTTSPAEGGGRGAMTSSGRLLQLLEEVRLLREQLRQGIRNSDALAEQLHSKLDTRHEPGETREEALEETSSGSEGEGKEPQRSEVTTQTTPTRKDHLNQVQMTPSWRHQPHSSEPSHIGAHLHPVTTTSAPEAKLSLGGIGTLTVKADVQMLSDVSTSSLPQLSQSASGLPPHTRPSLVLSAPRSHSSPFVRGVGLQHSSNAPSSGRGRREGDIHEHTHTTGGSGRHSLSDYLSREGIPKLEPVITPRHSHQSSASSTGSFSGGTRHGRHSDTTQTTHAHPSSTTQTTHTHPSSTTQTTHPHPSSTTQTTHPHPSTTQTTHTHPSSTTQTTHPHPSSTTQTTHHHSTTTQSPHSTQGAAVGGGVAGRDFESLESRLKQALESTSLQGADRSFLEELLGYLRQQRRQLDESWTLLQNLEKQKQQELGGASRVAMETSQSGTIPTSSGAGRDGGQRRGRGGERVGTTGVDLSSLYEHLLKTQASLIEAKTNLNSHQKHT